jgi:hypothetical protein
MITIGEYVGVWAGSVDWTPDKQREAKILLERVNNLLKEYETQGGILQVNQKTKSQVSGETYGGFRPLSCPIGAPKSSHKLGMAVDVYDPMNLLDMWIDRNSKVLDEFDLYREHPSATQHWCHLSTKAPGSGKRTFFP